MFMQKIPFIENTIIIIKFGYMSPVHSPSGCNMFYATKHSDPTQNTAPLITSGTITTVATPTSATPTRNVLPVLDGNHKMAKPADPQNTGCQATGRMGDF